MKLLISRVFRRGSSIIEVEKNEHKIVPLEYLQYISVSISFITNKTILKVMYPINGYHI